MFTNLTVVISDSNEINSYFVSIMQPNGQPCLERIKFYSRNFYNNNLSYDFSLATIDNVHDILFSIKSNAIGSDEISMKMLQLTSPLVDKHITHIVNMYIEDGFFPES